MKNQKTLQIFYTVIIVWLFFVQVVNGEVYPPTMSDVPVHMVYPEGFPPKQSLVIGQELFGIVPGLTMYATIWLREHNRVCDILKAEHPTWDDEQLFQTTRLIIIGEGQVAVLLANLLYFFGTMIRINALSLCLKNQYLKPDIWH